VVFKSGTHTAAKRLWNGSEWDYFYEFNLGQETSTAYHWQLKP
jgi:hypothetical protein